MQIIFKTCWGGALKDLNSNNLNNFKKFFTLGLFALVFFGFAGQASAATYYISVTGSDLAAGTSPVTAWRHHPWDAAATGVADIAVLQPGDTVLYRRGDIHYAVSLATDDSGTDGVPIVTTSSSDYYAVSADDSLPVLSGAIDPVTLVWTADGGSYKVAVTVSPNVVMYNGTMLLKEAGAGNAVSLNRWDWSANTLFVNVGGSPSSGILESASKLTVVTTNANWQTFSFLTIRAANSTAAGIFYVPAGRAGISLLNSSVYGYQFSGAYFSATTTPIVSGCTFTGSKTIGANGGAAIYASSGTTNPIFSNNTVVNQYIHGIYAAGLLGGNINNNNVSNCNTSGITFSGTSVDVYENHTYNNWNNVNYGVGTASGYGIQLTGTSSSNEIYQNLIESNYLGIRLVSSGGNGGDKIYNNIVVGSRVNDIDLAGDPGVNPQDIYNNTVYHSPSSDNTPSYAGHGIDVQGSGKKAKIVNNLVYVNALASNCQAFFFNPMVDIVSVQIDHNLSFGVAGYHIGTIDGVSPSDTLAVWQAAVAAQPKIRDFSGGANPEGNSIVANPFFVVPGSNFYLQNISPAIDSGTSVGLTTDYDGNPIYGAPDIGAYEYQPPHTIGTNEIDIAAGARIYADGKFRDLTTTSGETADLAITPESGDFTTYAADETRPDWLDITSLTWEATHKAWTESSTTLGSTNTLHTIGDFTPNTYYNVKTDDILGANITGSDCTAGICQADNTGQIAFLYTGGYSTHTFDIQEGDNTAPTVSTSDNNQKFHTNTTQATLTLTTDENSTCKYSNQDTVYAQMTTFQTTGETTHSTTITNLSPGDYTYYALCQDTNTNETSYTFNFQIAQRENTTDIQKLKLKLKHNQKETLPEDKKFYFDQKETKLQGQDETIKNGTVKIYKEGKRIYTLDVNGQGEWSQKISFGKNKGYTLKLKFYDSYGTQLNAKEYTIKIDTEKPEFIKPFPATLSIQNEETLNFEATDNEQVDYYKIQLLTKAGHILRSKKQTNSTYAIPEAILGKTAKILVRAYDKAGNYQEEQAEFANEQTEPKAEVNTEVSTKNNSSASTCSYTIQSGDTLWKIAKKVYNNGSEYQKIKDLNKDLNTATLKIGQVLKTCDSSNDQTISQTSDVQETRNVSTSDVQSVATGGQSQNSATKTFQWWNPWSWF
jgi:LysM repeat protein